MEVVTDADAALGNASYLLHLSAGLHNPPERLMGGEPSPARFKCVVFEDIDEILRAGAQGQSLSRLLNQADGIIGAGVNMLFILTSNCSLREIHPAIARPGRCLAEIEVPRLSIKESTAWLKEKGRSALDVTEPMSLAELYAVGSNKLPDKPGSPVYSGGQYL